MGSAGNVPAPVCPRLITHVPCNRSSLCTELCNTGRRRKSATSQLKNCNTTFGILGQLLWVMGSQPSVIQLHDSGEKTGTPRQKEK